jgi:hypothetical protein
LPARTEYERLQESILQLRSQAGANRIFVGRLEKTLSELDRFEKDRNSLFNKHLIRRDSGYSQIVSALDTLVRRTGVKSTRISYTPDPTPHAGLNTVAVTIPLEGNYSNAVNFIREVENSDTFFLITAISLSSAAATTPQAANVVGAGASSNLSLSLALETYFYQ